MANTDNYYGITPGKDKHGRSGLGGNTPPTKNVSEYYFGKKSAATKTVGGWLDLPKGDKPASHVLQPKQFGGK